MIKPLYNNVLLQKEKKERKTASGIILTEKDNDSNVATVIAIGTGEIVDGKLIPLEVKVGQQVIYKKYATTEFKYQEEEFLLVSSKDILGVIGG